MANILVNCDSCDKQILNTATKSIRTALKELKVCKRCYTEHVETIPAIPTDNQIPAILPASRKIEEAPEVNAFLQSISPVTNPDEVPHPSNNGKKFTQAQLFAEYLTDEQLKISELFTGRNAGEAYSLLEERIALIESIVFEAKTRGSELQKKKRELDALSGKNRWDKERRGEQKNNLSDPRNSPLLSQAQKKHKVTLSKVESMVKNMIDIGTEDNDIIDMLNAKFKGSEIREAIQKFR